MVVTRQTPHLVRQQAAVVALAVALGGAGGADVLLRVPVGTQIFDEDEETMLADFTALGQRVVIARPVEASVISTLLSLFHF